MQITRLGLLGVILGVLMAPTARADVRNIWLTVEGATCPKCGFGPVKALERLPGVSHASLTVTPQHLDVKTAPGVWLDPGRLIGVVRRSNLKPVPDDVRLTVTGTVMARDDGAALVLDGMKEPRSLPLRPGAAMTGDAPAMRVLVGMQVEIVGVWRPGAKSDDPYGSLIVRAIRRRDGIEQHDKESQR